VPRFDFYRNPNPRASHALFLDVQSDLVPTSTRWCVPLLPAAAAGAPAMTGAQAVLTLDGVAWLLDTPNILAVPASLLRSRQGQLSSDDRLRVEAALDFMLRGY
jgi:hypothetical protein